VTPTEHNSKTPRTAIGILAALFGLLRARGVGARIVAQAPPVFASISGFLLIHYTAQTHITVEVLFHARATTARGPSMVHLTVTATQRFALAVLAMGSIGALALPVAAQAETETPAPGWEVTSSTWPTNLAPAGGEGTVELDVYNIGAEASKGTITVTDTLPAGVLATRAGDLQNGSAEEIGEEGLWDCHGNAPGESPRNAGTFEPASVVTCTNDPTNLPTLPIPGKAGSGESGSIAHIGLAVKVETAAPGVLTNAVTVAGGGASAPASSSGPITVSSSPANFGFEDSDAWFSSADGTVDTQAGSHPYEFTYRFALNTNYNSTFEGQEAAGGEGHDITVNLPRGFVGNPTAVPQCTQQQFREEACSPSTQVGTDVADAKKGDKVKAGIRVSFAVYNLVPPPGLPAQFGFDFFGIQVLLDAGVRSGSDYGITAHANSLPQENVMGNSITFWGEPADSAHNPYRYDKSDRECDVDGCASSAPRVPFLTLPTACEGPQTFSASLDAWETAGFDEASFLSHDENDVPAGFTGCNHLGFAPSISLAPDTTDTDTPAGITVDVRVPQEGLTDRGALATSNIKDTTVVLPAGVVINPGQAAGLQSCSRAQAGLEPLAGGAENTAGAQCPGASKVGTIQIQTPLLKEPLEGDVYVLQSNPPNVKFVAGVSGEGVNLKLAGNAELCESSGQVIDGKTCEAPGQLVARVTETPELPFTNFKLSFSGGAQAALATPTHCGTYTTTSDFTPWSEPTVGDAFPSSSFAISSGPDGSACPSSQLPFAPGLTAGATTDQAGSFTGFSMLLQSADGQQRIDKLSFVAPPGLSGYLSNVPLCEEPQAAAGTCSASSQIGHSTVASGPGPYPLTIPQPGDPESPIYLTGPYEGAPFGLTIVTHVLAGPFNLGDVITRAKIEINPYTTQITITTDPLPQVIDGVPTDLREVDAVIDRGDFMINPTNCDSSSFSGTADGAPPPGSSGSSIVAPLASHFQVGSCQSLKFGPKFAVATSGKTSKAGGASLHVHLTYPSGTPGTYANIAKVKVELPKALPSRLTTLQKACTAAQFNSNPAGCPAASIIGQAKAISPIIPVPLVGPAYFVSHGGEAFPSLIMVLQGYGVTLDLVGTTFISKAGITSSTFKTVPDQPVGSFELTLPEGKFSALAANGNLCAQKLTMPTEFVAQNGAEIHVTTPISVSGCKPAITVVSHKVKGNTATITANLPAAGKLTAIGANLSKGSGKINKAGNVTVKLTLTKAGESLLKRHKGRKLQAKVRLTFTPKQGAKLKTTVTVLVGGKS
jgi:hypothetical protein